MRNETYRILAGDRRVSNDTRTTGLNNNDLIIGPSGAGKTRGYVRPNLLECAGSVIVADTKGSLLGEVGPAMEARGYRVRSIGFADLGGSCGYNPFDYIRRDPRTKAYSEQDIQSVCAALIPVETAKDPFWEQSARLVLAGMIGYVLECLPKREHTLEYVVKLFGEMTPVDQKHRSNFDKLFAELAAEKPESFAARKYQLFRGLSTADKTWECVRGFLAEHLSPLTPDGAKRMYSRRERVDFRALGREKTAVFLTVSDTDRSMDKLINLFYTQALQTLCASADRDYPDHALPVPVRVILDDFATNVRIPEFDKIISVIRSREISVSVILQSLSQLEALYGHSRAMTIINNCDNLLYLGGQDVETARYIGVKANRTADTILNMPLDEAYLFTRGQAPRKVAKYDPRAHERCRETPVSAPGKEAEKCLCAAADI